MQRFILIIAICAAVLWGGPSGCTGLLRGGPTGADEGDGAALDRAVAAYKSANYTEALDGFHILADKGGDTSQYYLGIMYSHGRGVPQDYAEAVKWYRKAAEQGHDVAQFNLGVNYRNGWGVPQDYAEAVEWYRKAAEQGHADAQVSLGLMYDKGMGVPQDDAEKAPRRASERRNLLHTEGGASAHRPLETALQHDKAAQLTGVQTPSTGNRHPGKA